MSPSVVLIWWTRIFYLIVKVRPNLFQSTPIYMTKIKTGNLFPPSAKFTKEIVGLIKVFFFFLNVSFFLVGMGCGCRLFRAAWGLDVTKLTTDTSLRVCHRACWRRSQPFETAVKGNYRSAALRQRPRGDATLTGWHRSAGRLTYSICEIDIDIKK